MRPAFSALAVAALLAAGAGVTACGTVADTSHSGQPGPTVTVTAPSAPAQAPASQAPPATATPPGGQAPASSPNVTDPWAVVSAYYGDIESGDYRQAWALLGSGATTGQTYQQFVNGFACTGHQELTKVSESGNSVTFDLAATDNCSGLVQNFTGTDTVVNGQIVAARIRQTS